MSSVFTPWKKYGYLWVTLAFFLFTLAGHWIFAWYAYENEQLSLGLPVLAADFAVQTLRDMLENWQSEFLQLIWQVAGLSFLFFIGSPQSKEGDDRREEKLDRLLEELHPRGKSIIADLDEQYPRE